MANTGYKQATIAYKIDAATGDPLDVNGNRTADSGLPQAIMLLTGTANPDPVRFTVVGYFTARGLVDGAPTYIRDGEDCPAGTITVTPDRLVFVPNSAPVTVTLTSSEEWETVDAPFATVSPLSGGGGSYTVTITPTANTGQGYIEFIQPRTGEVARLYIVSAPDLDEWILTTGFWNDLGFWKPDGIWNY